MAKEEEEEEETQERAKEEFGVERNRGNSFLIGYPIMPGMLNIYSKAN